MNDSEIIAYFVQHLAESDNPDDLIMDICDKTGRKWEDVESLLEQVRAEHEQEITRRQSPLLTMIALVTFATGVGILIYSSYFLVLVIQEYSSASVSLLGIPDLFQAILAVAYTSIGGLVLGLGMLLGSLLGMRQVWAAILKL
jgi:hypothetical protein